MSGHPEDFDVVPMRVAVDALLGLLREYDIDRDLDDGGKRNDYAEWLDEFVLAARRVRRATPDRPRVEVRGDDGSVWVRVDGLIAPRFGANE